MEDFFIRFTDDLTARLSGPFHLRILLQPTMAAIFAIIGGLRDARAGRPPYFWAMLVDPEHRLDMLRDGWKSIGRVFVLALALDIVYQVIEFGTLYVAEAIFVAFLLAILPYLILRGLITRLARPFVIRGPLDQ